MLRNALKILAAGATIAAIAFALITLGPRGEVEESRADVFDFGTFATTPSAHFVRSLEQLGHEKPRAYRVGEETVYFSARSSDRLPDQLVEEYQRTFVDQGVNASAHLEATSPLSHDATEMLRGEVMTFSASDRFMSMGGGVLAGLPETADELAAVVKANEGKDFAQVFRGFRSVQAERHDDVTIVTAVWSDDDFDITESLNPGAPSLDVPACPGCYVLPRFGTLANDIDRTVHHLESRQPPGEVQRFYQRALAGRGWVETSGSRHTGGERREYTRTDERLTVLTSAHDRGTSVTVLQD